MGRILISYIVPFLTPMALYALWIWYRTRYAAQHGGEAPRLEKGPWPLLLFLGALLTMAVLVVTALISGGSVDSHYVEPYVEDGKIVPGHLEPRNP